MQSRSITRRASAAAAAAAIAGEPPPRAPASPRKRRRSNNDAEEDGKQWNGLSRNAWSAPEDAKTRELLERSHKTVSSVLRDLMLPQIIDRSATPRRDASSPNSITIVFLTEPDQRLIQGLEGGRMAPGDVFLVYSPIWLVKDGADLYMSKGVWFDGLKQGYLDAFEPPRLVTFLSDFLTEGVSDGVRDDGPQMEKNLRCPMSSSSPQLEARVNDKVLTRCLLGNYGVGVPRSLAFPFQATYNYPVGQLKMILERLDSRDGVTVDFFLGRLRKFLERFPDIRALVVKPSGPTWCGSRLVRIFRAIDDHREVAAAMFEVFQALRPGNCLLVDEFLPTLRSQMVLKGSEVHMRPAMQPSTTSESHASALTVLEQIESYMELEPEELSSYEKPQPMVLGFRVRLLVARPPWGEPVVSKFVVGVGDMNKPIHGDNTVPQSLDSTLNQWGISDPSYKATLTRKIADEGRAALKAIMDYETELTTEERGCERASTCFVGLDIILSNKNSVIAPYVIEVNDHDCTLQSQMMEMLFPDTFGDCVRPWIAYMVNESQKFILRSRRVVVVGAGGFSKAWVWKAAEELGLELAVIDERADHFIKDKVAHWVQYAELPNRHEDRQHAKELAQILRDLDFEPDGCLTFWEDNGPITALLAEELGLTHNSYEAQLTAKSKLLTQTLLMSRVGSWPHKVSSHFFAIPSVIIRNPSEFREAVKKVPLPAVMKLEHGSGAVGVKLVTTKAELLQVYKHFSSCFVQESDRPGIGLGYDSGFVLAQYIEGSEHDVDVVLWEGQCLAAFVTDNGPTRLPYFAETSAWMPTMLHKDQEAALKAAAIQCCNEVGLSTGVFNVEMKLTSTGPRLLEINARPGGFYIRDWVKLVWGVDLAFCAFSIACGIKPILYPSPEPLTSIVGMQLYPSQHGEALKTVASLEHLRELHNKGFVRLNQYEERVEEDFPDGFEEPTCNLACTSQNGLVEAKEKLLNALGILNLDSGDLPSKFYFCHLSEDWMA